MKKRTVFIIDDQQVFVEGLSHLIDEQTDLEVTGWAADEKAAIQKVRESNPDLVILEVTLKSGASLQLLKTLRSQSAHRRILISSLETRPFYAEQVLRVGANGYIAKRASGVEFLAAIRQVLGGKMYLSAEVNELLLRKISSGGRDRSPVQELSDRELEVFDCVGRGLGTKQIADKLKISKKTVETHREHIRKKLSLRTTSDLVQFAIHWIHTEHAVNH